MPPLKINLAKSAGFCFGVKRALDIAFKTANSTAEVYMLGDIVHNEEVVKEIEKIGIKKIERLGSGKGKTLLIRAHGSCLKTLNKARRSGYKIIDATCPMVKEIHKIVKLMEKKGYKIIVIGDKRHDEVRGIVGQLKTKAVVIDSMDKADLKGIKGIRRAAIVVQSTQNLDNIIRIVNFLKEKIKEVKFFNTICKPTQMKQEEIKRMPRENDAVIIIGSKTSANSKRLYEISRSINKQSYWISSQKQVRKDWFRNAKTVGVTAGASTPAKTIKDIIAYIKSLSQPHS